MAEYTNPEGQTDFIITGDAPLLEPTDTESEEERLAREAKERQAAKQRAAELDAAFEASKTGNPIIDGAYNIARDEYGNEWRVKRALTSSEQIQADNWEKLQKLSESPPEVDPVYVDPDDIEDVTHDSVDYGETRADQLELLEYMKRLARGEGDSPAEMQAKRASERALAQQLAMSAGASGSSAAMAKRQAATTAGQIGTELAATSAEARAKEMIEFNKMASDVAAGIRTADEAVDQYNATKKMEADLFNAGVDLDVAKTNAAAGNAAAMANLSTELQILGYEQSAIEMYLSDNIDWAQIDVEKLKIDAQVLISQMSIESQEALAKAKSDQEWMTAFISGISTITASAVSDINLKKDIEPAGDRLTDFLNKLEAYDYDYKNPEDGEGRQTSVMAQDLEKSEIGKKAIIDTPEGKRVDYRKLLPEMLAANVMANKRINALEEALKKKKGKK